MRLSRSIFSPAASGSAGPTAGFVAICIGYFAIILDGSVLNVAVPAIRHGLGASLAEAQWVLSGYTLALAALLLAAGAWGDRIGLRRGYLYGTALFTVASAACAVAPSTSVLVTARVVQGVGAAALLPATLALIPHLFTNPHARARATVVWVATGAIAVAVGPLVGGVLIDAFGWRSIFCLNLPAGLLTVVLGRRGIAETSRHDRTVDYASQGAAIAALALLTAAIIRSGTAGWSSTLTVSLTLVGLLATAAFVIRQRRGVHPMVPPDFFADRIRAAAVTSAALMGFLFYGTLFVMSLYFQQLRGWSPGATGVALLPLTVGSTIGPLVLYRPLAARYGHPAMLVAGFSTCAAGIALLAWIDAGTSYALIAAGLALVGLSSTVAFAALTSLLIGGVPPGQSGLASGLQNTARQTGALMSVSILGSVLNSASFAGRVPATFLVLAAAVAVAIAVAILALCSSRSTELA